MDSQPMVSYARVCTSYKMRVLLYKGPPKPPKDCWISWTTPNGMRSSTTWTAMSGGGGRIVRGRL